MNKIEIAKRIYDLGKEIKSLTDEKEELRAELISRMGAGDVVRFETPEGLHRAAMVEKEEKILLGNAGLIDVLGMETFLHAAKVGCGALKTALKEDVCESSREKALLAECIRAVVKENVLMILKGGG